MCFEIHEPDQSSMNYEEIKRRFKMLKRRFIKNCVEDVCETFVKLDLSMSDAHLIQQIMNEVLVRVIIIPGHCESINCNLVREQVAKYISHKINGIVDDNNVSEDLEVPETSARRISFVFGPVKLNDEIENNEDELEKVSFKKTKIFFEQNISIFSFI